MIERAYKEYDLLNTTKTFEERYSLIKLILTKENMKELKNMLDKKNIKDKIEKWIAIWGKATGVNNYSQAKALILRDTEESHVFKTLFSINPTKQNIGEKMVAYEFGKMGLNFEQPHNRGLGAIYVLENGQIVKGLSTKTSLAQRSVDFVIRRGLYTFYITQKYTSGHGGGQNNQCDHLVKHLRDGSMNINEKEIFIALADGDYYTEKVIKKIQEYEVKNKCKFCSMDNIYDYIKSF